MIRISDKAQCCGCNACRSICPKQCISMTADHEGFVYPVVDTAVCVECGLCEKVCPLLHKPEQHLLLDVYAAKSRNDDLRLNSSSGAVFSEIAYFVFAEGGVVFGAELAEDFEVKHCCIESKDELTRLQGSKYVQSNLGEIFGKVKALLLNNKTVLFSGTPCQIAGLKGYLMKDYANLYTVDVVCHGVPSPAVYSKYLAELAAEAGTAVTKVRFRDKQKGWKNGETVFAASDTVFAAGKRQEPYMKLFLNNITIRPSCAECAFNNKRSLADITIADFWGIQKFHPEFDDDKGVTLVMVNSLKGQQLFNNVKGNVDHLGSSFDEAAKYNVAVSKSLHLHEKRDYFFENYQNKRIKELCAEILGDN